MIDELCSQGLYTTTAHCACFNNTSLLAGDRVVAGGEKIGAGTEVEAEAEPIRIEIRIRLETEKGLAPILMVVATKISYICGHVLDIFTPVCGVFSQTMIGLFVGLLFNTIIVLSGFINELYCPRGDEIIDGYLNKYFSDGLLSTAVATAVGRIGFNIGLFNGIYYQVIGGLRTAIMNAFLYGVIRYFNCFNTQIERGTALGTGAPLVTSHNIVLKFFKKERLDLNVTQRWGPSKEYNDKSLFLNEKEKQSKYIWRCLVVLCFRFFFFFCW